MRRAPAFVLPVAWLLTVAAVCCALVAPQASAADATKTLRVSFPVDVTGFDPQAASDAYSNRVNRAVFDTLLEYDYLPRPFVLKPSVAEALPEITDGGRTITFRLRRGITFAPDPAFNGKRELTADDFVYSWKRLIDP